MLQDDTEVHSELLQLSNQRIVDQQSIEVCNLIRARNSRENDGDVSVCQGEWAAFDARHRDWDTASRIATAEGALKRGIPARIVRQAYGRRHGAPAAHRSHARRVLEVLDLAAANTEGEAVRLTSRKD